MAEFRVAAVFSNNMVLQREKNVNVFGEGNDGETVQVTFCGQSVKAKVKNGAWNAVLAPMSACDGETMKVSCPSGEKVFYNVAVGEVWLAGGQSNMEFELQNCKGGLDFLANDKNPGVRFYYTQKNAYKDAHFYEAERNSGWSEFDPESAKCWSAVGYFYAKRLAAELGCIVGVIGCNWGGTSASAWMDRETLLRDTELRSYVDEYEKAIEGKSEEQQIAEYKAYEEYDRAWNERAAKCYAEKPNMSWAEVQEVCGPNQWPGPMCCINPFRPAGLYECMLQRVMPYTLRGFIYYQGESDDHKPQMYARLLTEMIAKWRKDWADDTLPFLMVQLPMHRYEADPDYKHWCLIREAQMKVYNTVKNTGIAVILDLGEFNEIHPKEKVTVGERLALQAMYDVYGLKKAKDAFGPIFHSCISRGDKLELHFDYADEGFQVLSDGEGFEVAGEDGCYVPAKVQYCDKAANILYIYAEGIDNPVYARYCWTNYGAVNYFGKNGIPMAPFRTSDRDTEENQNAETKVEIRQVMEL